jgi:hypothetical protein
MEPWQTIVKSAILGTERGAPALAPAGGAAQDLLGHVAQSSADPQSSLLSAAAVLDVCRRAGRLIERHPVAVPPCGAETHQMCSRQAGSFLSRMLSGEHAEMLDEFLTALACTERLVPPEHLPELLELGRARRAFRSVLAPVVGRRGLWLALLNNDWRYLAGGGDEDNWETAAGPLRLALLRRRRTEDPAAALAMLQKTWAEEPPEARAEFVAALEVGLGPADEAFLERTLDDRRKEVRAAAAELLSRLADSSFCHRMMERVAPLVTFSAGQKGSLLGLKRGRKAGFTVTLPAECDKAMIRDGIEAKVPPERRGKIGEKAWWLVQMLGCVPPGQWLSRWNTDAVALVRSALDGGEWKDALLESWCAAACRHRDAAWAEALLTAGREWVVPVGTDTAGRLVAVLLPEARERLIVDLIGNGRDGFGQCPMSLLRGCDHAWSDALSERVVAAVAGIPRLDTWHMAMTGEVSRRVPRAWLARLVAVLTAQQDRTDEHLRKSLQELIDACQFRHDALASVAP